MTNISVQCIIVLTTLMIVIIAFGLALLISYNKHKAKLEELMRYKINVNASIDEKIPAILDTYINDIFMEYRVANLEYEESTKYINKEEEQKIVTEVGALCGARLSQNMVDKLSLFWNPQEIGSVIANKVAITVALYVANNNIPKDENINDLNNDQKSKV